ncbi:protein-L-isoaspartate O-methyltransferase family protein [Nocardioides iriomotensis]|uniref:Protein-L-isoaspartate O-methyltransferase n=1 Tax=Nocardioides iriomotensis TaxID=715784 RepID=A0A4Q5JAF6_9ACTN|nr:protein-L-isoaspartate O-methyltransferase [Nocardioides iriomotensis]RYU15593.1 protein-L-isoaspartate O-methyltransferase [Nocardioides iriomotensis]
MRREWFLPPGQRPFAGLDQPLPIGHDQTNSQPTTVRHCLEHLDVRPGQRVLDVGCGSAWTTALLAHLVGPDGDVTGVEVVPELVAFGRANLEPLGLDPDHVRVEQALPDALGWPARAPYDRVLVSAEASELPDALVAQLADDGVLVVPVAGRLTVATLGPDRRVEVRRLGRYRFVPLRPPVPGPKHRAPPPWRSR